MPGDNPAEHCFLCKKVSSVNEPRQQDVRVDVGSEHDVDAVRRRKIRVCEMKISKKSHSAALRSIRWGPDRQVSKAIGFDSMWSRKIGEVEVPMRVNHRRSHWLPHDAADLDVDSFRALPPPRSHSKTDESRFRAGVE